MAIHTQSTAQLDFGGGNSAARGVRYGLSREGWGGFVDQVRELIRTRELKRIVEIGGGANPSLLPDEVQALGLDYTVLDISAGELAKAPAGYRTVCADIAARDVPLPGGYDLAFSRMLAEHVRDGRQFHSNVHRLLRDGGLALHFFPTLWAPPFIANWLLPERWADAVLQVVSPQRDRYRLGKFPAYYDWCRGPNEKQLERFAGLGYEIVDYCGYFGHGQYYRHLGPVQRWHLALAGWLQRHPNPHLTSFASVLLQRRGRAD